MKASAVQRKIDAMVRRIVKRFGSERIVLFGSHARGDAGPDSDVDLLVVMPVRGSKRNKAIEIAVALDDIRIPKDIIVTTPNEFAWRKEIAGTIEKPAAREGKVVYARPSVALARRVHNDIGKHLPKERKKRGA
jgi:predicted nucleotidyltransferase